MSNSLRTLRRRALRTRGFTLLEILVVLTIIGLLVGLAVNRVTNSLDNAQMDIVKAFVKSSMTTPLMSYRMDMGGFPTTAEGLAALCTMPQSAAGRWRGPYVVDGKIPLDPWNEPYQYACPGKHNPTGYDIWSKGPTNRPMEIGNWESATEGATGK
jgi:general secretion pathway protein G